MRFANVDDIPNTLSQRQQLTRDCMDWVAQYLPAGLPPSVRRDALSRANARLNPNFWRHLILQYQTGEFTEADQQELCLQLFREACSVAASQVERMDRVYEMERWRYVPRFQDGVTFYLENLDYVYNTTYDYRKPWFEFQLQLERTVLPAARVTEQGLKYETALNRPFLAPHWRYDSPSNVFVEISDSKWVDGSGTEHPNPGLIRGTTERYSR